MPGPLATMLSVRQNAVLGPPGALVVTPHLVHVLTLPPTERTSTSICRKPKRPGC